MELVTEIQTAFANLEPGHYQPLTSHESLNAWAFRTTGNDFGVGLEREETTIVSEHFATARLKSTTVGFGRQQHSLLVLENSEESLRNEFAWICADFVTLGPDGTHRKHLLENPAAWWVQWKNLIGNSVREKTTHGVLGELIVYLRLLDAGIPGTIWPGPERKSHDLETEGIDYEVKSTISRYGSAITVSGQHQLEISPAKALKLLFCRFENVSSGGESIDSIVRKFSAHTNDIDAMEQKLSKLGFEAGCSARREQFVLHDEIIAYSVDDDFPKITGTSFRDGHMPTSIIQLTYQLELAGLPSEKFMP